MATPNFSKFSNNYTSTTINGSTINASNITCSNALTPTISIVEDEHTVITGGLIADGIDVVVGDGNEVNHKKFLEKLGKWIKYVFFVINQDISVDNRISLAYTIYTVRN